MKLKDLQPGFVVETKSGNYLVIKTICEGKEQLILMRETGFMYIYRYNEDLTLTDECKNIYRNLGLDPDMYDINKVYNMQKSYGLGFKLIKSNNLRELIWERK